MFIVPITNIVQKQETKKFKQVYKGRVSDNSGVCLEHIHKNGIYQYNKSKNDTFVIMINKFPLGNFFYDIS